MTPWQWLVDRRNDVVSAILVDACRQAEVTRPVSDSARRELIDAARFHRIAPLVHVAHRSSAPEIAALFGADRLQAITAHLRACAALEQLGALLRDVDWVTFKGPVFSEHAHPVPGLRTYNDVDVLVAPTSLREVSRRLLAAGWQVADYRDMLRNEAVPGEMHWISPTGALVDLHWSMINMAARRALFTVPTTELLQRRVAVDLGPNEVWTLDSTDTLVHACLHAALAGAHKLIYLVDVDRLSRHITDWDDVAARALAWRAQAQLLLVLSRAERVLGTPVPASLGSRLGVSRPLRTLMAATDHLVPVQRGRTGVGLNRFVARAVRSSGPATAHAVVRNATRWLHERVPRAPRRQARRLSADEASLEVYLTAVESASAGTATVQSTAPIGG